LLKPFTLARADAADRGDWIALRRALWPDCGEAEHHADTARVCANPDRLCAFIARDDSGLAVGFVEASLRSDYVNGTQSSPVGFIEGLYVVPEARRRSVARSLIASAEAWARSRGCSEMASDALLGNVEGHAAHRALGYVETDRVVYFYKRIAAD